MKTPEDEAFDDLARRQGAWGGGFPAKKAMAADKLQEPAQEPVAWQWLGSAHFRKKIPKNADITAWNPVYSAPQRPWVGLTEDELLHIGVATGLERAAAQMIADKLKEKNT